MNESEIRTALRDWIIARSKRKLGAEFDSKTKIVEDGIISSLDIAEFILFLENLRQREIDIDSIEPSHFADIDSIYTAFFVDL